MAGASSSTTDEVVAASLQAEAWGDCGDAMVLLTQEQQLQKWKECAKRVEKTASVTVLPIEDVTARPPEPSDLSRSEVNDSWERLRWALSDYGLQARDVKGDGACQFRAVADQLFGNQEQHAIVRARAVAQLQAHPEVYAGFAVAESFEEYLVRMSEPTTWGDNLSLQAIADAFNVKVCIVSSFEEKPFMCICPMGHQRHLRQAWLGFFAELHYTSLEPQAR